MFYIKREKELKQTLNLENKLLLTNVWQNAKNRIKKEVYPTQEKIKLIDN